ncbi:hypothetical protein [Microbacterium terricola]|uniref:Uncharacterized protein n=1 Tax=Microbacterium terricola TaxID=344163 RepID=A0ABM8DVB5_9MICO|nr:hypothetical protein [Microbacterium terricola]UYK39878.1 hypothetical protein OAU46_14455 [Microbacterium terricola]BDV29366.1 hypothetical protein Microterr_00260 [Microbacterium terricola]
MASRSSLGSEIVWLVICCAILVLFIPTAVRTMAATSDWTTGSIDVAAGDLDLPTWLTFGVNCLLVLLAAFVAVLTAALIVRRVRSSNQRDADQDR